MPQNGRGTTCLCRLLLECKLGFVPPFALFFGIVTACRKEESGRTVHSEKAKSSAGATQRGASSEDKHRLLTRDDRHSHENPVHISVPPMPARGT